MRVIAIRDIQAAEDHNFSDRDIVAGETFYVFEGCDYGCIDYYSEIAVSEYGPMITPFFALPKDAVVIIHPEEM